MKQFIKVVTWSLLTILFAIQTTISFALPNPEENPWPKKIETDKGKIIIYQPQVESYTDNTLEARAAVSVTTKEVTAPVFGAMWFDCRVSTDKDERTVELLDLIVSAAKFPDSNEDDVNPTCYQLIITINKAVC